jgi:tRNA(adenine34) deaminase
MSFTSPEMDDYWMRVALSEADHAVRHADVPVGCVVVHPNGTELGRGRNRRELENDPTAHAEVLALRSAAQHLENWRLDGATLYVTLEPCLMCLGAILNARISRLVYSAADPKAGAVDSCYAIGRDGKLAHRISIDTGVFERESQEKLRLFFSALRAQGKK